MGITIVTGPVSDDVQLLVSVRLPLYACTSAPF